MRRATGFALLSLLGLCACEEPDRWVVVSNPSGNGFTAGGRSGNGGGTIVWTGHGGSSGSHSSLDVAAVVNAPVAPEAIYLGFGGAAPGIAVLDLNGFGQGTGNLATTRFPFNPNIGAPGVVPPLFPGTSSLDAGGAGALTLTQDSSGRTRLCAPLLGDASDLQLGQPLDLLFNNAAINRNAPSASQVNPMTGMNTLGNTISIAPHPNPPRLVLPPPNPAMGIGCEEPTVASTQGPPYPFRGTSPPMLPSPINLLVPGNPFATQPGGIGIFGALFPGVFYGPQPAPPPPAPPPPFLPYVSRQQIGHFLYVLDRVNSRVVVLNSNRMTLLASIAMPAPVDMAMSPDLARLAVSNGTGDVLYVDTDPLSPTFHQIVAQTRLGPGITKLAWQPEGEDLLVLDPVAYSLTLIDGRSLQPRRVVGNGLFAPRALAVGSRQTTFGNQTGTWFAFVLNGDGSVAVFESGPAGPAGIGFDDLLGIIEPRFPDANAIIADAGLGAGFWIAHQDAAGLGQVSAVQLVQSPFGPLPLPPPTTVDASQQFRQRVWAVVQRYGGTNATTPVPTLLSGNAIVDLAFDDIVNVGALPDQQSPVLPGLRQARHSGKNLVKLAGSNAMPARTPRLLFVALGDTGSVDVLEIASGRRLATVPAPGIRVLCDYWRQ